MKQLAVFLSLTLMASMGNAQCHLRLMGDVNGDGKTDIVGFGNDKVWVSLGQAAGTFSALIEASPNFTAAGEGWSTQQHIRQLADVNGDGRMDIVGFGNEKVYVALGRSDGRFNAMMPTVEDFTAAQGWNQTEHLRLIADVNGDGKADIVAFGRASVFVALGQANGQFATPITASNHFHVAEGWTLNNHIRYLADVNGDGKADIIGFGNERVYVALGQADGRFSELIPTIENFTIAQTWNLTDHPRFMGDVNGDGRADIVGCGTERVWVALGQTNGQFGNLIEASTSFTMAPGERWSTINHIRQLADVNGDGRMDMVGFGNEKVYVALGQANGTFGVLIPTISNFTAAQGWNQTAHLRWVADVNGDRKADIIGFGDTSVFVSRGLTSTSGWFSAPSSVLNNFTIRSNGWVTCPR